MKLIETKCDFCKIITKECEELQIGDKLYDLCSSCMSKINKLINGSGRPVVQISIPTSQLGGWLNGGIVPNYVPTDPYSQPYQVTYGNSIMGSGDYKSIPYQAVNSIMNVCSTIEA